LRAYVQLPISSLLGACRYLVLEVMAHTLVIAIVSGEAADASDLYLIPQEDIDDKMKTILNELQDPVTDDPDDQGMVFVKKYEYKGGALEPGKYVDRVIRVDFYD